MHREGKSHMSPGPDPENWVVRLNRERAELGRTFSDFMQKVGHLDKEVRQGKSGRGQKTVQRRSRETGKQICVSGDSCCSSVLMGGQVSRSRASRA